MRRNVLIEQLLGDRPFRVRRLVTRHGCAREIEIGLLHIQVLLGLLEISVGLLQLLVDLRRLYLCQKLARRHLVADVHVSLSDIAAGPGIDDRVLNGLVVAASVRSASEAACGRTTYTP